MKNTILFIIVFVVCVGCASMRNHYVPPQRIAITIKGQTYELEAGAGFFWDPPVYNEAKTTAYVVRNVGNISKGWTPVSITQVTEQGVVDPVFKNDTLDEDSVLGIRKVSDDGKRLIVELSYVKTRDGDTISYDERPVILDIEKGTISEIEF